MSSITLRNNTNYLAQFIVTKGQQIIARIPGIEPNAQISIPTNATFEVVATTVIDGNTYTSAPHLVQGSMGFLAQVLQLAAQGVYVFDVLEIPSRTPNALEFQKTCLSAVTFTITKDRKALQNVVVKDNFMNQTLDISDTFYVYAVVNGVTTGVTTFTNSSATITAVTDDSNLENGYVTLYTS